MIAIPFQTIIPVLAEAPEQRSLFSYFRDGGDLMWVLLGLSVLALMVFFICLWTTRRNAVLPERIVLSMESYIRRKDYAGLLALCEKDGSSFANTVNVIIMFLQRNPRANMEEVREVANAEGSRQANMLTRQISWLSDIGALAPMVGLLGTVLGMIQTFQDVAQGKIYGIDKQLLMGGGIAQAMITTAFGLLLAIPSMFAYVVFRNRIQKRITDMEVAITHILSVISVQMDREQRLGSISRFGSTPVNEALVEDEPENPQIRNRRV